MATSLRNFIGRVRRLGLVAIASFLLNVLLTIIFTEVAGVAPQVSFAIVLVLIFSINFFVTRYWVFKDRVNDSNGWAQFIKCIAVSMTFRLLEWSSFYILLEKFALHYVAVLVGVLCISFAIKSLIYDRFVFR